MVVTVGYGFQTAFRTTRSIVQPVSIRHAWVSIVLRQPTAEEVVSRVNMTNFASLGGSNSGPSVLLFSKYRACVFKVSWQT